MERVRTFFGSCDAGVTILNIFLTLVFAILGGLAIDASQAWRVKTILQVTADAAAHAAAVRMSEPKLGDTPTGAAIAVTKLSLAPTHLRDTLFTRDVDFGHIDDTGRFQVSLINPTAVQVALRRQTVNSNSEPTFLLPLIGLSYWNIAAVSTARIKRSGLAFCHDPLLSVQARVELDTPMMYAGVCVKANAGVTYGLKDYVMSNEAAALVDAVLASSVGLADVDDEPSGLGLGVGDHPHEWFTPDKRQLINALVATATHELTVSVFDPTVAAPGETYHVTCTDHGVLYVPPGTVLSNVVLLSECPIKFAAGVTIEASVVLGNLKVLATSDPAVSVTRDEASPFSETCAPDGGLMLLVYADLDTRLAVPALAEDASPFGAFLNDTVDETGGLLAGLTGSVGDILSVLTADLVGTVNGATQALGLDSVCLGAEVLLTGDTITLSTAG